MKLRLVKQGDFLGTKCDFYVNETGDIFMSRTQIGYALQYKRPQNAITIIHKRYPELLKDKSLEVAACQFDTPPKYQANATTVYMYNERGIYTIVRKSNQTVADEYFDWVYDIIQSIKQSGYYIISEKDEKWLGVRQETKEVRKAETDQRTLLHLKSLETVVELHMATLMAEELPYKEVYQGVKKFIESL